MIACNISVTEEVRQNGIMTAEEYDRQNRIKKLKSFESEETVIAQPHSIKSPSMSDNTFDDDVFDTSSIRLSTEAHIKRKMFRKVICLILIVCTTSENVSVAPLEIDVSSHCTTTLGANAIDAPSHCLHNTGEHTLQSKLLSKMMV